MARSKKSKDKILASGEFWKIQRPKSMADNEAEILIYGDIGESYWNESVTAKDFVEQIADLDDANDTLIVRINSYGGSVSDGIAIHNAMRRFEGTVNVHIDGVAMSSASLISMAGDTVSMTEAGLFMVHAPWGGIWGNAKEMREQADMLDKYSEAMATTYVRKTGKDHDTILSLLTDGEDHFYTAAEAVEFGFVDEITELEEEELIAASAHDLSRFDIPEAYAHLGVNASSQSSLPAKAEDIIPAANSVAQPVMEQATMPVENKGKKGGADKNPEAVSEDDIRAQANADFKANEDKRKVDINAAFKPHMSGAGVSDLHLECLNDMDITAEDANKKLLAHLGATSAPIAGDNITAGESEQDKFREGGILALSVRAGLHRGDKKVIAANDGNNFRGYSLLEMARASLEMNGVKTGGMDKMSMIAAAFTHTSSDFTSLLENTANKSMLRGYDEAEETFQDWTVPGVLSDFKTASRVNMDLFPSLREVKDGGEYKYVTVGDSKETLALATYGELFSITRQTIINDDLDAFSRLPRNMGRAAIRTVGNLAYAILTDNGNMADGVALFHANHNNLLATDVIDTASVDKMRVAMAKQKSGDATLNIRLAKLIVPVALEGIAKVTREAEYEVDSAAKNSKQPNSVRGTFDVISDARLDANSASKWYGAANPMMHDTVEVAYLDGNDQPFLEEQDGWKVDGVEFKVRIDATAKALDAKALAANL